MKLKISTYIVLSLLLTTSLFSTLYEDAEDGDTQGNTPSNVRGWFIYDTSPSGAVISNIYDAEKQSRVIHFNGSGISNGYMLGDWYPNSAGTWNNTTERYVHWCAKYTSNYVVYMRVYTSISNGTGDGKQRYVYYTAVDSDGGLSSNKDYIHHGIGTIRANGEWHSINRNLEADLDDYDIAGNDITSVVAFLARGTGSVDDIYLTSQPLKPKIELKKSSEVIFDPINKTVNPKRITGAVVEYSIKANNIGLGEATNNSVVIEDAIPSELKVCVSDVGECKKPLLVNNSTYTLSMGTVEYKVGATWSSTPTADAEGYNSNITAIRIPMLGVFPGYCGTERSFEIKFRAGIK